MTAINDDLSAMTRPRFALSVRLLRLLARLRHHRRAIRTYMELARLDDRLIYDIGLEPLDLHHVFKRDLPPSVLLDAMRQQVKARDSRRD